MKKLCKIPLAVVSKCNQNVPRIYFLRQLSVTARKHSKAQNQWNPVIGLEVHAQIPTKTKLFSEAPTSFATTVNSGVTYFDCAAPGTLPVLNRKCVEAVVLTALALSCKLNEKSVFERKHYFYADLPAGYQITQHKYPLAVNGQITFNVQYPGEKGVCEKTSKLKQIQLEQDSGRTLYDEDRRRSLVDLNRAGIPLMEFVFEPDLSNGYEAAALVKELALILQLLGTCSCKMQEGALRVDANVSICQEDGTFGNRTEIKNIGSIGGIAAAISYEIKRQTSLLEKGEKIYNETRGWDAGTKQTVSLREKEEKLDYRFMLEANLPPLHIHVDECSTNEDNLVDAPFLKCKLPELPAQTRKKLSTQFQLTPHTIFILLNEPILMIFLNHTMKTSPGHNAQKVSNFLINELLTLINKNKLKLELCVKDCQYISAVITLFQLEKKINRTIANKLLDELLLQPGKMPEQIVEEKNWFIISNKTELERLCQEVIDKNPEITEKYKKGTKKVMKVLTGQVATITSQRADMPAVQKIMENLLN